MDEFFRGWQRKAGCAALVVACVFATGWTRSLMMFDVLKIPLGESILCHCYSAQGSFACSIVIDHGHLLKGPKWTARRIDKSFRLESSDVPPLSGCLSYGSSYWTKVIPFTLITVYLLLFKPRPPTPVSSATPYLGRLGTRRDYIEVLLVAFAVLANADILTWLWIDIVSG